jgi:Tfp pilus assembly protein PilO
MRIADGMVMKRILVTILFTFLISQLSFAGIYKWVDEKGTVHFTDDMTQVPEKYRPKAEEIGSSGGEKEGTKGEGQITPEGKEETHQDQLGRGENYWKGQVAEWRKKLGEQQDRLQTLEVKYNELTIRFNDSKSSAERGDIRRERDQVKNEMDQCRTQIEEAKEMIEKKIPEEGELYKAKPEWVK